MRAVFSILLVLCSIIPGSLRAQCVGLPSVTSLGSNKFPTSLCAPVQANVTYAVAFASPVTGTIEIVCDWGDGTAPEVIPLASGSKSYNASQSHQYPLDSDCEYFVTMAVRYNGKLCTNTLQLQKIPSWRTDAFNGGNVSLASPVTRNNTHLVCEGDDVSVIFEDKTNWNCNTRALFSAADPVESPNTEYRWQQIIYNRAVSGDKIPNVSVDGVLITGNDGVDLNADYQDPRGVFHMSAPVVVDDARRRPSLKITAPGGFGGQFPKAGDAFAITLRYWNFCNPYDDPEIPGPPADRLNGDHPPVEATAYIQIVAPPPALKAADQSVCFGTTPNAFSVTGASPGNLVNWYRYVPGSEEVGALITSSTSASLPITSHPEWKGNKTPGILRVWATQRSKTSGGTNCESPKVLVARVIRENLVVPDPMVPPPAEVCNGQSFTVVMPASVREPVGGGTGYTWSASPGISVAPGGEATATFSVNIVDFGSALFVDRTVTIGRQFTTGPACLQTRTFNVRVYRTPSGGVLSGPTSVCETGAPGTITLSGAVGNLRRWEVGKDGGPFLTYTGDASGNAIMPGALSPGVYTYRAVVANGPCIESYSDELRLTVSADPGAATAGDDQFICNDLQSAELNANIPLSGTGLWTFVSSVPSGLPSPAFNTNDPNTTVVIEGHNAGVYTLRWTVTNGSCESFDDVIIDFGTNPTDPDAGDDRLVCGSSAFLDGNVPLKGQGSWSVVSGPGCAGNDCGVSIVSSVSSTSEVLLNGPVPAYGQYTFRWSISSGGNNCFLKSDDVTFTFEEPVVVTAEDVTSICLDRENPGDIEVSGAISGPILSAQWTIATGSGTLSSSTLHDDRSITAVYRPSAGDYDLGEPVELKLVATPRSASCAPVERVVRLHLVRKPVAIGGADLSNVCDSYVALGATAPLPGTTGVWTTTAAGVSFDDPTDSRTIVRNLPLGVTDLSWTVSGADGQCASLPATIRVERVAKPVVSDIEATECATGGASANVLLRDYEDAITSLDRSFRDVSWFKGEATDANSIPDPSTQQAGVADGQVYVARVRDTRTGCSADARLTIRVRPLPVVMNAVMSRCEDVAGSNTASGIDLSAADVTKKVTAEGNVRVMWYSSEADAMADRFSITDPVMVSGQKEFVAKVIYADAPFCYAMARLNIVVNPQPAITRILGRESVCQGVASSGVADDLPVHVYQVTPIPGARYYWEIPGDPDTEFKIFGGGREQDFYVLLQFPNVFSGKIRVRAELNGCSGPVIEKQIAVSSTPSKPLIEGASIVCENDSDVPYRVVPNNAPSSVYNWDVSPVADEGAGEAYIMEGQLTGNVLLNFGGEDVIISVRESNAECVSPVATKVIKVATPPSAKLSITRAITCFMTNDGAIATEVTGGTAPFSGFEIVETGQKDPDNDGIFDQLPQGSYRVRLRDANGCAVTTNVQVLKQPDPLTIDRIDVPADANGFNVSCDGGQDGEIHVGFSGGNDATDYTVSLWKNNSDAPPRFLKGMDTVSFTGLDAGTYSIEVEDAKGCRSMPSVAFIVRPMMHLNIQPGDTLLCNGEQTVFHNNSIGVDRATWYYIDPVSGERVTSKFSGQTSPAIAFDNETSKDPLVYEVVYEAENNSGCHEVYRQNIYVYRSATASFAIDSIPAFEGESVSLVIDNTSTPLDPSLFDYKWSYGEHGAADGGTADAFEVVYYSPGVKDIRLNIVNRAARNDGKSCASAYTRQIMIPVNSLDASFTAGPFAACSPVVIKVRNTTRGADTFTWKLFRGDTIVSTSNLRFPEFSIAEPGTYEIHLTAGVASTGQVDEAALTGLRVMEVPRAAFEVRADVVYVPDTEIETMNFSVGANLYTWQFGDGGSSDLFEPVHAYEREGRYSVILHAGYDHGQVDTNGDNIADRSLVCYDSAWREVLAMNGGDLQIPNAFTPDTRGQGSGDGINDVFLPTTEGIEDFHMQIYDRWGILVFESRDPQTGWDGYDGNKRLLPAGVYVYKIVVRTSRGEHVTRAGDVTLIR